MEQVATPTELFNNPVNLFVAGFIGSPAMNVVYGNLTSEEGHVWANFAGMKVKVAQRALERHPGLENHMNARLVIGIRPGDFEHAHATSGPMADEIITVGVDLTEMLGSESYVHFNLNEAPVITPDIEELLADTGADASTMGDQTRFTARVSADIIPSPGDEIRLAMTTGKMLFFDPDTGDRIGYQRPSSKTLAADVAAAVPTDDSSTDAAS